eukprot:CAMPEP_0181174298 /NCGR_PEP_ID=MMETSP1096-20121128/3458_1 /TAXON_ID=156174 ORGANISM="Chrysochromulina ericina, Strain CCMP281" /NCGR_SAMPLE_ID=MMETSP1096 /ASSEMBLY_ACC=CAM_ASM_000453 /LENGTH=89 /DNA_ID=CAMNT_0023262183 /DNA_START=462 /DNA_END=731 /DNA_ORIENTATION=+
MKWLNAREAPGLAIRAASANANPICSCSRYMPSAPNETTWSKLCEATWAWERVMSPSTKLSAYDGNWAFATRSAALEKSMPAGEMRTRV